MDDPQDLLYTNKFITKEILTTDELNQSAKYYNRYEEYNDKKYTSEQESEKFINNDNYEDSFVNRERLLNQKWPISKNTNHYPLFDTYINDISSNIYKKKKAYKINIDTRNRNQAIFPAANNFSMNLMNTYTDITKIYINDIIMENTNQTITNYNNILSWQYATSVFLKYNNIDNTIIPTPSITKFKKINFSDLPNSVYKYKTSESGNYNPAIDNLMVNQITIPSGNYTTDEFRYNILINTQKKLHNAQIYDDNIIIEAPYLLNNKKIGTPHLFDLEIDPSSNKMLFVNRIEKEVIIAIQTFSQYTTNYIDNDIFYYYSSNKGVNLDPTYIYITLQSCVDTTRQYYNNLNYVFPSNPFPLVITGLEGFFGNITSSILNYTEFFDLNIYLTNGYEESDLESICYYKFIDEINIENVINGNKIETKYLRFAFHLSNGMLNGGIYKINGKTIVPCVTNNIIFQKSLSDYFSNIYLLNFKFSINSPLIGRALLYRWVYDIYEGQYIHYEIDTYNEKKRSLLGPINWPISNQTQNKLLAEINQGYHFVHTNYQQTPVETQPDNGVVQILQNNIPYYSLNLTFINNSYYINNNPYIFIKMTANLTTTNLYEKEFFSAYDSSYLYNQIYVSDNAFNVGIGCDYTAIKDYPKLELYKKELDGFFTKIILSPLPSSIDFISTNTINNHDYILYQGNIDNMDRINIQVFTSDFKLLQNDKDFSFTLNIESEKTVLKETLVNSKTNIVSSTGHFI
jgi:hypothetical protein